MPKTDPKEQKTSADPQTLMGLLHADHWRLILRKLTAREQTPLRQVSRRFRELIDQPDVTGFSSFGSLMVRWMTIRSHIFRQHLDGKPFGLFQARFVALPNTKHGPTVDAMTFRNYWLGSFWDKLKPLQIDFLTAVICGDVLSVESLLRSHPKLTDLPVEDGSSVWHFATVLGDVAMLNCLCAFEEQGISYSASYETRYYTGAQRPFTPLEQAIAVGDFGTYQWLKQRLQDYIAKHPDTRGITYLRSHFASLPFNLMLFGQDQWLDAVSSEAEITAAIQAQDSLLFAAARAGNVTFLKRLLANPAYEQLIRAHLQAPANRNIILFAILSGDVPTFDFLTSTEPSLLAYVVSEAGRRHAFAHAIQSGDIAMVKKISELCPDELQSHDPVGRAIHVGSLDILVFLLARDAPLLFDESNSVLDMAVSQIAYHSLGILPIRLAILHYLINHLYQGVLQGRYAQAQVDKYYTDALYAAGHYYDSTKQAMQILLDAGATPDFISKRADVQPFPELEKAKQDYQNKLKNTRWQRGLLGLGFMLLGGSVAVGTYVLLTMVAMPLVLSILAVAAASLLGAVLTALTVMTVFKIIDDRRNLPFFSRVRLKPFAPVAVPSLAAEELAVRAKIYYSAATEAKASEAVQADPTPSNHPGIEFIQLDGEVEAAMPALALNA